MRTKKEQYVIMRNRIEKTTYKQSIHFVKNNKKSKYKSIFL
jgi:hypothetical protein